METLIQLSEIPFKDFTLLEKLQNFNNMMDVYKLVMILLISFSIIFAIGFTAYWLYTFKNNYIYIGRIIVINSLLLSFAILQISADYLPKNNYELYIYDYQESDTIYESVENPHDKYLYRDGYYKINGYRLEKIVESPEFHVIKK